MIAVIPAGEEAYIRGQAQQAAAPAAGKGPATEELQAALAAANLEVPQGFQVFVLPANASIPGLTGSLPIPASFNLPAALQSFNYLLKPASSSIDIPPTYTYFSPEPGAPETPGMGVLCCCEGLQTWKEHVARDSLLTCASPYCRRDPHIFRASRVCQRASAAEPDEYDHPGVRPVLCSGGGAGQRALLDGPQWPHACWLPATARAQGL